jgi:hypothetical protein
MLTENENKEFWTDYAGVASRIVVLSWNQNPQARASSTPTNLRIADRMVLLVL